jgi:hypothetical protein
MDEQKNQQNQTPVVPDYTSEINAMYDAQRQQQLQSLESAYNQNTQTLKNSLANNAKLYNERANDLSAQYERTRMNNNMRAASNGISTGAASQMDLAQQANYLNAFGGIRSAQADSEAAINQQIANLELTYKNAVSDAIANNDHERAAALLAEYKRRDEAAKEEQRYQEQMRRQAEQDALAREQYNAQVSRQAEQDAFAREQYNAQISRQAEQDAFTRQQYANSQALNKAQLLAQYGNFSGYAELYGQDVANAMQQYYDMMAGGSGSSSSRSSGSGYRGSGSTGSTGSTNGPGQFNNDIASQLKKVGDTATDANGNVYKVAGTRKDGSLIIVNQGNGQETALDILARRSQYANDEQFALGEMSRIRDQAAADASRYAQSQGMRMGSDEYNRFVQLYTQHALANNPDYADYQDMYQNESQLRVANKKAEQEKAKSEYLQKNATNNLSDASSYVNFVPEGGLNNSTTASQWANGVWDELVHRLTSPRNGKGQIISKKK